MKKSMVVLLHLWYWILYVLLLLFMLYGLNVNTNPGEAITFRSLVSILFLSPFVGFTIAPALFGFYSSYLILFPKFLNKKRIIGLIVYGLLFALTSALLPEVLISIFFNPRIMFTDGWNSAITITISIAFLAFIHEIIGLIIRGFISWYGDIKLKEELSKKHYEMELALVKSQINPHFLFNTINNIDILIEKDAAKASAYLNKLSDIMRFMLYETKTEKILLVKELTYIEKYIDLQRIRTSNPNYVTYSIVGDASNIIIDSMLFIPFIENAFKHAEHKKAEKTIAIYFVIEKDKIIFNCENAYTQQAKTELAYNGLGNELIQKRLMLLYPGKHTLTITDANEIYTVNLIIERNE